MNKKSLYILLMFVMAIAFAAECVFALPKIDEIVSGDVVIDFEGSSIMNIQASDNSIINFFSFDILENEAVFITLPSIDSQILNRVTGNDASDILGILSCNGLFVLVNEAGIYVGENANISSASIILSTRGITDTDFINHNYLFEKMSEEQLDILLLNEGKITVSDGGFGVLIAGAVENRGIISATAGKIVLAGGDAIRLDISNGGLISVAIEVETASTILDINGNPITDQIKNTGTLEANGGVVLLRAESITDIFEKTINLDGIVRGNRFEEKDGVLRIVADGDIVVNADVDATKVEISTDGNINVSNDIKAGDGGINIFADKDGDGSGEFRQISGLIEATGTGDIAIDGSGEMELGDIKTELGAIKIGETRTPTSITGSPRFIHSSGDINIIAIEKGEQITTVLTSRGDVLRYSTSGDVTLEAVSGIITDLTLTPIPGNYLKLVANEFYISSMAVTTHLVNNLGDINIDDVIFIPENVVTVKGEGLGEVTYIETNNITFEAPLGDIDTAAGVSIPGNQVKVSAQRIGTADNPVGISANVTYINRIQGEIDIMEMTGIGSTIFIRGPAPSADSDSWGAVSFNRGSLLVLDAEKVTISGSEPAFLLGDITFHNFECTVPGKEIYFEAGSIYTFNGTTYIKGEPGYDGLIKLLSSEEGAAWYSDFADPLKTDISYVAIGDAHNIGKTVKALPSTNWGNVVNWDTDPVWDGGGTTLYWSDALNWDTDTVPTATDVVTFNTTSSKDSIVDTNSGGGAFGGTVATFTINGYTGVITLERDLTVTGNFTQNSGTFNETDPYNGSSTDQNVYNLTVSGTFSQTGGTFRGATGSTAEAVRIASAAELQAILTDVRLSENFVQFGNIDLSSIANFNPIGTSAAPFTGTYNGNKYTLSNLTISRAGVNDIGIFGYAGADTIFQNVTLVDVDVTGKDDVGALIGQNFGAVFDSSVTGTITANNRGGGLVGQNDLGSSIANSNSSATVTGNDDLGGLVGKTKGAVTDSFATGNVSGHNKIGGLVGNIDQATGSVTDSYATGTVSGNDETGGLAGKLKSGSITNSYATGTVTGTNNKAGGLVGHIDAGTVTGSYATGTVSGKDDVGGLAGKLKSGSIIDSYATGTVTGTNNRAGGLVGQIDAGTVTGSYATGDVNGTNGGVGGLAGNMKNAGSISTSFATGDVSGGIDVGGLVGWSVSSTITDSHAWGKVTGTDEVGGLVGDLDGGSITTSYATGFINSVGALIGGFAGSSAGSPTFTNNFWDTETSGQSNGVNGGTVAGVTGKTTSQMFQQTTYTGFNFTSNWSIVENGTYAYLQAGFPSGVVGISGDVYSDQGVTGIGSGADLVLVINGTVIDTKSTTSVNMYNFMLNAADLSNGDSVLVYIDDHASSEGNIVTVSTGSSITGLDIYAGIVIARHETAGPITNTNFNTAKGALSDSDILYSVSGGNLTTSSELIVWTGDTFTPGGNLTVTGADIEIDGTLNINANTLAIVTSGTLDVDGILNITTGAVNLAGNLDNSGTVNIDNNSGSMDIEGNVNNTGTLDLTGTTAAINVAGNWSNSGTFLTGTGTVTFDASAGTQDVNSGGSNFNNLVHSGAGILRVITNNLVVGGTLTNSAGTLNTNALDVTVTGLVTISGGEYQASTGTQTFNGGLTVSGGTFTGGAGNVDVNGNVTLSSGTLTAPSSGSFNVSGNWTKTGGTFTDNSGTVTFDGGSTQTLNSGGTGAANDFNNVIVSGSTLELASNALEVDGTLTIQTGKVVDLKGQNLSLVTLDNLGTLQLLGSETLGIITPDTNSGLVKYYASNGTIGIPVLATYFNLEFDSNLSGDGTALFNMPASGVTVNGTLVITDGTVSQNPAEAADLTINNNGGAVYALSVAAGASFLNNGVNASGDLTLGGDVFNAGTITFDGGALDTILIRSSVNGTQRDWAGNGTFNMTDVDVKDQTRTSGIPLNVSVISGKDSGNNINWFVPAPTAAGVKTGLISDVATRALVSFVLGFSVELMMPLEETAFAEIMPVNLGTGFDLGRMFLSRGKWYTKWYPKKNYTTEVKVLRGSVVIAPYYEDKGPDYKKGRKVKKGDKVTKKTNGKWL